MDLRRNKVNDLRLFMGRVSIEGFTFDPDKEKVSGSWPKVREREKTGRKNDRNGPVRRKWARVVTEIGCPEENGQKSCPFFDGG